MGVEFFMYVEKITYFCDKNVEFIDKKSGQIDRFWDNVNGFAIDN